MNIFMLEDLRDEEGILNVEENGDDGQSSSDELLLLSQAGPV